MVKMTNVALSKAQVLLFFMVLSLVCCVRRCWWQLVIKQKCSASTARPGRCRRAPIHALEHTA